MTTVAVPKRLITERMYASLESPKTAMTQATGNAGNRLTSLLATECPTARIAATGSATNSCESRCEYDQ